MEKGVIIILLTILFIGIIAVTMSETLANILIGILIGGLGIFNLVVWYIIKTTSKVHKAYLLNVTRLPTMRSYYTKVKIVKIAKIQYSFKDKEYITEIGVQEESPLADRRNIGKEMDIYMSEKFPKIVVDKIQNNSTIYAISIFLFISGLFIATVQFI